MYLYTYVYIQNAPILLKKKALICTCCHLSCKDICINCSLFLTDMLISQFIAPSIVLSRDSNTVLPGGMFLALPISVIKPLFMYS